MAAFESKKFSWRSGYSYMVPAETVGNVLEDIEKRDGVVTSESFLDYSRPEDSVTHELFEWDDSIAAEKYRKRQATQIINQLEVHIVCEERPGEESSMEIEPLVVTTNAYMNVVRKAPTEQAVFVNAVAAYNDGKLWKQVMRNAVSEMKAFHRKYSRYKEFAKICEAITETEKELTVANL